MITPVDLIPLSELYPYPYQSDTPPLSNQYPIRINNNINKNKYLYICSRRLSRLMILRWRVSGQLMACGCYRWLLLPYIQLPAETLLINLIRAMPAATVERCKHR